MAIRLLEWLKYEERTLRDLRSPSVEVRVFNRNTMRRSQLFGGALCVEVIKTELAGHQRAVWAFVACHPTSMSTFATLDLPLMLFFGPEIGVETGCSFLRFCCGILSRP
jgi:hypothetical protein